jgi:tetratricopeptide (TPR) repeat protein
LERAERAVQEGEGQQARRHYLEALSGDSSPVSQLCYGTFLHLQGDCGSALPHLQQAWERAKELDRPSLQAAAARRIADLCRNLDQADVAFQYQQLAQGAIVEALRRGEMDAIGEQYRLGMALNVLLRREPSLARRELTFLSHSAGDLHVRGSALLHLARLQLLRRGMERVSDRLDAAREVFHQAGDRFGVLACWELNGQALARQARWEEAQDAFAQALLIGQRLLHESRLSDLRDQLRRVIRAQGVLLSNPEWN